MGEGVRTGAFLLGAQEGTEEGCVCRHSCCCLFRQQALTPATVPGQGQLRWPRGAQSAPLNTGKIPQNRASLVLRDFSCVLVVRELAWRLKPSWRKRVCSSTQAGSPVGSPEGRRSFGAGLGARSAQRYPRQIPVCMRIHSRRGAAAQTGALFLLHKLYKYGTIQKRHLPA